MDKGAIVEGTVTYIANFGAFIKLDDGRDGLAHISEIADEYITNISDFVNVGDQVKVKILGTNKKNNKLEFSLKQAKKENEENETKPATHLVPKDTQEIIEKKPPAEGFEDKLATFLKKSEEIQVDIRRNLKIKQGFKKKKH